MGVSLAYTSFEEMPLWQQAHALALRVYEVSASFPKQEDYGLTSQLRRAAVSIPANVAEAFGRYHYRDKLNFYYHCRGSACETRSHLLYAHDVGYLNDDAFDHLVQDLDVIMQQLNTVIATIRHHLSAGRIENGEPRIEK
jgi:four helix bundle protein